MAFVASPLCGFGSVFVVPPSGGFVVPFVVPPLGGFVVAFEVPPLGGFVVARNKENSGRWFENNVRRLIVGVLISISDEERQGYWHLALKVGV